MEDMENMDTYPATDAEPDAQPDAATDGEPSGTDAGPAADGEPAGADTGTGTGDSGDSGEDMEEGLTERLGTLIDILTPEEPDETEGEDNTGESDAGGDGGTGAADTYTQELLESINGTLTMIKSENVSYHADVIYQLEEISSRQEHLVSCVELVILLVAAAAFFVAYTAGCKVADSFFNRMRG